ncbi:hypothetical protein I552_7932 [Mycobacterium xenopi 3993]|nr:hypothetical protein I552_7932 [Mycobacterium xenopi 3993]
MPDDGQATAPRAEGDAAPPEPLADDDDTAAADGRMFSAYGVASAALGCCASRRSRWVRRSGRRTATRWRNARIRAESCRPPPTGPVC